MQRSREPGDFQDFENQYERRPSAWVEPKGDGVLAASNSWKFRRAGRATTTSWSFGGPRHSLTPNHPEHFEYRLTWEPEPPLPKGMAKVVATRSGASLDGKRRVFILDFVGAGEKIDGLRLDLAASRGKISNATLTSNVSMHGLRASFEIDPNNSDLIELRLRVMRGDQPITETWLYRWTAT